MPIDSNLFRARIGVRIFTRPHIKIVNLNMWSRKREPNIYIKRLTTMPLKKSFKIPFFMLIILFLLVVFLNSSFTFIFKSTSESIKETNLSLSDYMFTISYLINNFKHLQEILRLIPVQNDHLKLNFITGT